MATRKKQFTAIEDAIAAAEKTTAQTRREKERKMIDRTGMCKFYFCMPNSEQCQIAQSRSTSLCDICRSSVKRLDGEKC